MATPNFNMHSIKRQARKEAWYGDSYNPFRRVQTRAKSWATVPAAPSPPFEGQLEQIVSVSPEEIRPVSSPSGSNIARHLSRIRPQPEAAFVEQQSARPPSPEEKAQRKFLAGWKRKSRTSLPQPDLEINGDTSENVEAVWKLTDHSEELSWDPFGGLSESIAELPLYPNSNTTALRLYSNVAQQRFRKRAAPAG